MVDKFTNWFKFRMWGFSWVLLVGFVIVAFLDFYSTLANGDVFPHLEANPIFMITGSLWPVVIFNVFALYCFLRFYDRGSIWVRYFTINLFTWLTATRLIIVYNNFKVASMVHAGEVTIEVAKAITTTAKINEYALIVSLSIYAPLLLTSLVYWLFKIDHKITKKWLPDE